MFSLGLLLCVAGFFSKFYNNCVVRSCGDHCFNFSIWTLYIFSCGYRSYYSYDSGITTIGVSHVWFPHLRYWSGCNSFNISRHVLLLCTSFVIVIWCHSFLAPFIVLLIDEYLGSIVSHLMLNYLWAKNFILVQLKISGNEGRNLGIKREKRKDNHYKLCNLQRNRKELD